MGWFGPRRRARPNLALCNAWRARVSFLASPWNLRAGKVTLRCVALRRVRVPRVGRVGRVWSLVREDTREGASVSEQVLNVLIE